MSMDFNGAEKQRMGGLIPANTVVPVHMTIRPGGAGERGFFKATKDRSGLMLDCEFTVTEGEYARRKLWSLMMTEGESDGQRKAADITRSRLRAMLEAARGINPSDESAAAMEARRVTSYEDFDGLRFQVLVGIEKGTAGYQDKNVMVGIITPDHKSYVRAEQVAKAPAPAAAPAVAAAARAPAGGGRPTWA